MPHGGRPDELDRLLLGQAVDRAQPQDQDAAIDAHDPAARQQLGQDRERPFVGGIPEDGHQADPVRQVEVGVAAGKRAAVGGTQGRRGRQGHDPERLPGRVAGGAQAALSKAVAYMGERKAYGAIGCSEGILDRVENQNWSSFHQGIREVLMKQGMGDLMTPGTPAGQ